MKTTTEFKKNQSFLHDLLLFLAQNKKWYLIPIVVVMLLMGILIILGATGAAPFIYTLF
ncbi:MAG TPA: DUF5989 family protein [Blastocatellia bacterium]|nr:DUF5989 family protein [Blastocatellia bacterium]